MSFLISNFYFEKAKNFEELFYSGEYIKEKENTLLLRKSNSIRNSNAYDKNYDDINICKEVIADDFYIMADYDRLNKMIYIQTDIVSYEIAYFYLNDDTFVFSNDINRMLEILSESNYKIELMEDKVRELIYFGRNLFEDTPFKNIIKLKAASIYEFSLERKLLISKEYNSFKFTNYIKDEKIAAKQIYNTIDEYFESNKDDNLTYGLGLSGGLDSRVAAYFAKKYKYNINAFFIGVKSYRCGILTNDAKRSIEVAKSLNIKKVEFKSPKIIDLIQKIENDANHSPIGAPNVAQNIGYTGFQFEVLIHGMMGGELFGEVISDKIKNFNNTELAEYILTNISLIPRYKYKRNYFVRLIEHIPMLKSFVICNESIYQEVLSKEYFIMCRNRMENWIMDEKSKGLSNINIFMKEFLFRFSSGVKTGYYSTLNDRYPAMGIYMNPKIIRDILCWDDSLFLNRVVQYELIQMLGEISEVRTQNYRTDAKKASLTKCARKIMSIAERVIRGGGMVYTDWFNKDEILRCEKTILKGMNDFNNLRFKNKAFRNNGMDPLFVVLKLAIIKEKYGLEVE